jgi:hypothetical protein
MYEEKIIRLKSKLSECETGSEEYIRCLANIIFLTTDKGKQSYADLKIVFTLGLESVYGHIPIDSRIAEVLDKALDLIFAGDFKGYCLTTAVIKTLEEVGDNGATKVKESNN